MANRSDLNARQPMTAAARIVQTLDFLGIAQAHVAAHLPSDWLEFATIYPNRIKSLTLVCPERVDADTLQALASRLLIITGDQPPFGEPIAQALGLLPGARHVTLEGYTNVMWNDPIGSRIDVLAPRLIEFWLAGGTGGPSLRGEPSGSRSGTVAGVSYQVQGQGEPLVLLPLGLAPTQWDALLPALAERFLTVLLGGAELGVMPLLEQRGNSAGYQRLLRSMFHELAVQPGESILDVGCGSGVVERWLAGYFSRQNPIAAVDINAYLLREARALAREAGLGEFVQFREGDATALPFDDNSFDIVFSTTVMEEVDADAMLAELVRVCRPSGRIGVIVRALDMPRATSVMVRPELRARCEAPAGAAAGLSNGGCAGADLYRRFHQIGLGDVRVLPDWTVFNNIDGAAEQLLMGVMRARVTADEFAEWRAAADRAVQDGTFFMTWPHHCAVGTKPGIRSRLAAPTSARAAGTG